MSFDEARKFCARTIFVLSNIRCGCGTLKLHLKNDKETATLCPTCAKVKHYKF